MQSSSKGFQRGLLTHGTVEPLTNVASSWLPKAWAWLMSVEKHSYWLEQKQKCRSWAIQSWCWATEPAFLKMLWKLALFYNCKAYLHQDMPATFKSVYRLPTYKENGTARKCWIGSVLSTVFMALHQYTLPKSISLFHCEITGKGNLSFALAAAPTRNDAEQKLFLGDLLLDMKSWCQNTGK